MQDLIVTLKSFNMLAGSSAPMMSRKPKLDENGLLDAGSTSAAVLTQLGIFRDY